MKQVLVKGAPKAWRASRPASPLRLAAVLAPVTLFAMTGGLAACSSNSQPQSCPRDVPASCPSPAPTFSADVAPLIQSYCAGCHSAGGQEPNPLLISYDTITGSMGRTASTVESWLGSCRMPPADQPQPTSQERQAILGWIVCGAKND